MGVVKTLAVLVIGIPVVAVVVGGLHGGSDDTHAGSSTPRDLAPDVTAAHDVPAQPLKSSPIKLPSQKFDAAAVLNKPASAAPSWWGKGETNSAGVTTFRVGMLRIIVRPSDRVRRIALWPDGYVPSRDSAALQAWASTASGSKINGRAVDVTGDTYGLAIVDAEDEVRAKAAKEAAQLASVRKQAAQRIEQVLLDHRIDSHVVTTGADKSVVRVRWALCSRVTVKDIRGYIDDILAEMKATKLECYDGFSETAWIDLK